MRYNNQMHDRFNPGTDLTCHAATAVTGKTFLSVAGPMTDNLVTVTTATAGAPAFGVAKYNQDAEQTVGVARGSSRIVTVTADGAITAGTAIIVGDGGKAQAYATPAEGDTDPVIVGYAVDTTTDGADVLVDLTH